jgi:hypothetical protein
MMIHLLGKKEGLKYETAIRSCTPSQDPRRKATPLAAHALKVNEESILRELELFDVETSLAWRFRETALRSDQNQSNGLVERALC